MDRTFSSAAGLSGTVEVPADKSLAHRAVLLGAMGRGTSVVRGAVSGQDVSSTMDCLRTLGAGIEQVAPDELLVRGTGWQVPGAAALNAGNSGTTMRLLSGALAGRNGTFELFGDQSLSRRPMRRVADPLRLMGATIELAEDSHPPLRVTGGPLRAISYSAEVASAQVKGAILLAGLQAEGTTTVVEAEPTRDHTERFLAWLGAEVRLDGTKVSVTGTGVLFNHAGFDFAVPGDLSSAAFLLVAAILCPNSDVTVTRVGLNPGRTGILEVLNRMGAALEVEVESEAPEPVGRVRARSGTLEGVEISGALIVRTIDELPLVALAATQAEGTTLIRDAADLRAKESDRIAVLVANLRTLGAEVEELPDGLKIEGPTRLTGGSVNASGDHRMAMTFAVAGLIARAPVTVHGWEAAAVSYPEFDQVLAGLAR